LSPRAIASVASVLFLAHAARYLYFFVDDEAIPFVYARNLLRGRGLVYTAFEGRVEGYSDFLTVLVDTILLGLTRIAGAPTLSVFAGAKLISLAAGATIVWLISRYLASRYRPSAALTGIALVVLAGPLAMWSCSALEAAGVALLVLLLALAIQQVRTTSAVAAAILLTLIRIDGFIYVGAAVVAAAIAQRDRTRLALIRRVALTSLLALALLTVARFLYFGSLVPTSVEAKVLYKLVPHAHLLIKQPAASYLGQFLTLYGAVFLLAVSAGAVLPSPRPESAVFVLNALFLAMYVSVVGDWMFGLRFFVPVLPLVAVFTAEAVDRVSMRSVWVGRLGAAVAIVWMLLVASSFSDEYRRVERRENFLTAPTLDPGAFFKPYWAVYTQLRDKVPAGTVIADNQAGFVPFMLDAENIDDLGICSRFYAELPTRDVFFTEVGRFMPLTNKDARSAGVSYLVYRRPALIIEREDLLRPSNNLEIPPYLLGGAYQLWFEDSVRNAAVYAPTASDVSAYRRDRRLYLENVAHLSHLSRVTENGRNLTFTESEHALAFVHEGWRELVVTRDYSLELHFDTGAVPVYELHIERLRSAEPAVVALTLWDGKGVSVHEERVELHAREWSGLHVVLPAPVAAATATLSITGPPEGTTKVVVDDLRVQAQPLPLERYVAERIIRTAPASAGRR
jgi:hypothetical protein